VCRICAPTEEFCLVERSPAGGGGSSPSLATISLLLLLFRCRAYAQLTELGLVDEYRVVVQPIVAGEGRRLFDRVSLPQRLKLKLVESKILKSGCVALRYVKQ
jgi:hypothetical protein